MTAATLHLEHPDRGIRPAMGLLPRLELRANSVTLEALGRLVAGLPITGDPAGLGQVLGFAATMLTGGMAVTADETLPDGAWVLSADGRELSKGTVEL